MMVTPYAETFPYQKRYKYPHMKPEDIAIWERFIEEFPDMYENVQYDVPCGSGPEFDTLVSEETGGHIEGLYKKRIDVVAYKGNEIDLIELKPKAGAGAIGQVKGYRILFIEDYSPSVKPKCIVITNELTRDLEKIAYAEGVQLVVV